jgi:hypothetical protein
LISRRLTILISQKILDNTVDEVFEALSIHVVPQPYGLFCYLQE